LSFHPSSLIPHPSDYSIILSAFLLDLIFGDPRWFPHPVILIGKLISFLDGLFRGFAKSKATEFAAGAVLALIVPFVAFISAYWLIRIASSFGAWVGWLAAVFLGYTVMAAKSLYTEPLKVVKLLSTGDIQGARRELSYLVGRDVHELDDMGIVRALVETVAENASDGVVAPLFYLAIGGPPLAMAYKAVNTLDSMVGYKNDRYLYFGRASARIDDLLNFIPARLTALLIVIAAFILRKDWKGAWKITLRDGRNHPSPNSGYPEAAVAGALGRRLGGLSYYGGAPSNKPFIGDEQGEFQVRDVREAGRLMIAASTLMVLVSILLTL
jgi:adenosylcobinamide-phosphate synthase